MVEKSIMFIRIRQCLFAVNICLLLNFSPVVYGVTVTETGIGSAQTHVEGNNIEELRSRAIRNLLETAVLRVSGAIISGEQKDTLRTSDSYESDGGLVKEKLKQDSIFQNTIVAKTNAYAKIVEIVKEWQDKGNYYIKAVVEVSQHQLQEKMRNAGIYWERVGNPTIYLSIQRLVNNQHSSGNDYSLKFLRSNLARNGITVITDNQGEVAYSIPIKLSFSTKHLRQFNTFKTNCSISYEIIDSGVDSSVAAARKTAGPVAGFTKGETQAQCEKAIVPQLTIDLVKRLTLEMNEIWNNGRNYSVTLINVDGSAVTQTAHTIRNIFRVTNLSGLKYRQGHMQVSVKYKGLPFEFVDNLLKTFEYSGQQLSLDTLAENVIKLKLD